MNKEKKYNRLYEMRNNISNENIFQSGRKNCNTVNIAVKCQVSIYVYQPKKINMDEVETLWQNS